MIIRIKCQSRLRKKWKMTTKSEKMLREGPQVTNLEYVAVSLGCFSETLGGRRKSLEAGNRCMECIYHECLRVLSKRMSLWSPPWRDTPLASLHVITVHLIHRKHYRDHIFYNLFKYTYTPQTSLKCANEWFSVSSLTCATITLTWFSNTFITPNVPSDS